jgi:hypothetical protein
LIPEGRRELLRAHDLGYPGALAWLSAREPEDGEGGEDGDGLNA